MDDDQLYDATSQIEESSTALVEDESKKYDALFDYIDTNDDGKISREELMKYAQLCGMNPTDEERNAFFKEYDVDGNSSYDKTEFIQIAKTFMEHIADPAAALDDALNEIDKNNDRKFNKDELRAFLTENGDTPLTHENIDELFEDCNIEGEFIDREVLKAILLQKMDLF